uniref:RING-type E3 ubiquitin transferase n=1 Tax=Populus trichocarpa TaxID=3694 RepID=A0A3N7H8T7_POPTR
MANFTSLTSPFSDTPMVSAAAAASSSSSSSSLGAGVDDAFEDDSCSICLDPFTAQDPATVTCCNHEYHLQCILEWSQRSKECPICWQLLVLKDHASQELLAAVETERLLRSRNSTPASMIVPHLDDDYDVEQMTLISMSISCSILLPLPPAELIMFTKGRGRGLTDLVPPRLLPSPLLNM